MFIAFISWWYGAGWRQQAVNVQIRLARMADTFSIGLLLKTLFMPFRQISAEQVDGSLGVKFQAMIDKMVSRVIGAVVRSMTIITGAATLLVMALVGAMAVAVWPIVPLVPLLGVVFFATGWLPWTL